MSDEWFWVWVLRAREKATKKSAALAWVGNFKSRIIPYTYRYRYPPVCRMMLEHGTKKQRAWMCDDEDDHNSSSFLIQIDLYRPGKGVAEHPRHHPIDANYYYWWEIKVCECCIASQTQTRSVMISCKPRIFPILRVLFRHLFNSSIDLLPYIILYISIYLSI